MKIAFGIGAFLTLLLAVQIAFAQQNLIYLLNTLKHNVTPPSNFPCQPVAFDPTNPAASGYQIVFQSNFATEGTSQIDMANTKAAGFKWYILGLFNGSGLNPSDISTDANGLIINQTSNANEAIKTVVAPGGGDGSIWHGTVFSGGAYYEGRFSFLGSAVTAGPNGWPAFWTDALEHIRTDRQTAAQWPGQAAGYEHYVEDDFFEYDIPGSFGGNGWGSGIWDWSGISSTSTCSNYTPGETGFPTSQYCGILNDGQVQQPNNVFLCRAAGCPAITWNDATFHTMGHLRVNADANNGQVGYMDDYFDGVHAVPANGIGTAKTTYSNTTMPPPANLPGSAQTWSVANGQHFPVIIGTGTGLRININFIRVWQIPGCGTMTVQ